jgi:NAD(P)-dependent dehydrogenase (short-subunit alcohol dehydrogenase family)
MVPTESFYRVLQFTDADMPKLAATVPLGRMGTPEDMAAGVLYLASPAAGWVTGQNILIGGGRDGGKSVEHR